MILIHFWLDQAESLLEMLNYYAAHFSATLSDTVNLQRNTELAVSRSGCYTFFMGDSLQRCLSMSCDPVTPMFPSISLPVAIPKF